MKLIERLEAIVEEEARAFKPVRPKAALRVACVESDRRRRSDVLTRQPLERGLIVWAAASRRPEPKHVDIDDIVGVFRS